MARSAITLNRLAMQQSAAETTTAADVANGHSVDLTGATSVLLHAVNTAASEKDITIKSTSLFGESWPDLTVTVPAESNRLISVQELVKYTQSGHLLHVDLESGFTGTLSAIAQEPSFALSVA